VIYTIIARNGSKFHENPLKNTAETADDDELRLLREEIDPSQIIISGEAMTAPG
jgi:hypothetical protein